ncbi:MAG: RnfABCDGE type electron transport complex subunit D [Treponema sp.]|nr:RnfABCDGE type electron transport complex subunit D [Treponema sp.]
MMNNDVILKVSHKPFVYFATSIGNSALFMTILLMFQVLMLFITKSYDSLLILLATLLGIFVAKFASFLFHKKFYFHPVSTLLHGLIIGFLLPSTYSPISVFCIIFFVMLILYSAFTGFADSWFNPVVLIVAIAWLFSISSFPTFQISRADLFSNNPSLLLIQNGTFPIMPLDSKITDFLNKHVFELFGMSVPEGYVSLFWDTHSVIPAFRFNVISLLSSVILISYGIVNPVIPGIYLLTYLLLVLFGIPIFIPGMPGNGDMLLALLSSGTLFCTVFILQWYGTTPLTMWGKICYGFIGGLIAFLIIGCGTSPIGSVFTVLILNVFSLFVQFFENELSKAKMHLLLHKMESMETKESL